MDFWYTLIYLIKNGMAVAHDHLPENKEIYKKAAPKFLTLVGGALVGAVSLPFSVIGVSTIASALTVTGLLGMLYGGMGTLKAKRDVNKNVLEEIKTYGTSEQQDKATQLESRIATLNKKINLKSYSRAAAGIVIASGVGIVSTIGLGVVASAAVLYATRSKTIAEERKEILKQLNDSNQLALQIRARRQGRNISLATKENKPV